MAKSPHPPAPSTAETYKGHMDEPLPSGNDPGGAHGKGYSADPNPEAPVPDNDPVPLAGDADVHGRVKKPDQSGAVKPAAPHPYSPNDRLMGADR